jgi:hypothetical protein
MVACVNQLCIILGVTLSNFCLEGSWALGLGFRTGGSLGARQGGPGSLIEVVKFRSAHAVRGPISPP